MSRDACTTHAVAPAQVLAECRQILEQNSQSFALAARLLPETTRDRAAALYAYCRRVDDAIDACPAEQRPGALSRLRVELDAIYRGEQVTDPAQRGFQALVAVCDIPERYPRELIEGMAMDVRGARYATLTELLLYCHRVAGVVGLMICHVFGVRRDAALVQAAQLGLAMQLTNICRDVAEDYALGRIYLPRSMWEGARLALPARGPLPRDAQSLRALQDAIRTLLAEADRYYDAAERGIHALPLRAGLAVRAASHLYRAIGQELRRRDCDPTRGRAVVPTARKLWIVARACALHLLTLPLRLRERRRSGALFRAPRAELKFPADLLAPPASPHAARGTARA
jgi:phytoene synthase